MEQGSGDGDSLALSAGEFGRFRAGAVAETDTVEEVSRSTVGSFVVGVSLFGMSEERRETDIFGGTQVVEEVELLEDEPEGAVSKSGEFGFGEIREVVAPVDGDSSRVVTIESTDDIQKCGLARSGCSDDRREVVCCEIEGDIDQRSGGRTVEIPVGFVDRIDGNHATIGAFWWGVAT